MFCFLSGLYYIVLVLSDMTKNFYQGIFQNYTCFTVYDVFICFMHCFVDRYFLSYTIPIK